MTHTHTHTHTHTIVYVQHYFRPPRNSTNNRGHTFQKNQSTVDIYTLHWFGTIQPWTTPYPSKYKSLLHASLYDLQPNSGLQKPWTSTVGVRPWFVYKFSGASPRLKACTYPHTHTHTHTFMNAYYLLCREPYFQFLIINIWEWFSCSWEIYYFSRYLFCPASWCIRERNIITQGEISCKKWPKCFCHLHCILNS